MGHTQKMVPARRAEVHISCHVFALSHCHDTHLPNKGDLGYPLLGTKTTPQGGLS